MKISSQAIDHPLNVFLVVILIVVLGILGFQELPIELLPEVEVPVIFISVEYRGASASEIEFQVNKELENELKSIQDIKILRSVATPGVGTTIIQFKSGSDLQLKKNEIREAVDKVLPDLPEDIEDPVIKGVTVEEDFALLYIYLYGAKYSQIQLKDFARELKNQLESVPKVSEVAIYGGLDREIRVYVDPNALRSRMIPLRTILNFFNRGNLDRPGGKITLGDQNYYIRVLGKFVDDFDIRRSVLTYRDNQPVYLKELGNVRLETTEVKNYARLNGLPAIFLALKDEGDANVLELSKTVRARLDRMQKSDFWPEGLNFLVLGDQADEVNIRVSELTDNIIQGIIIVFFVLLISIGIRNAMIVSLAIPFTLIFTSLGLFILGGSINNISQFGIILVLGIVVDGAIVILENTYRHIEMGKNAIQASKDSIQEVGSAVISSGLTTIAGFAPMLFMTGIVGQVMKEIPTVVIIALIGALLFDHILIPLLASRLVKVSKKSNSSQKRKIKISFNFYPFIFKTYRRILGWSLNHRTVVLTLALVLGGVGFFLFQFLRSEFLPEMDTGNFTVFISLPKSSSVEKTNVKVLEVEKILRDKWFIDRPGGIIKYYSANVGVKGGRIPYRGRVDVTLVDISERDLGVNEVIELVREELESRVIGARFWFKKPQAGPPTAPPVNLVILGSNVRILKQISDSIRQRLKDIPGLLAIRDDIGLSRPEIQMSINRFNAERYGILPQNVQDFIFVLNNGYELSKYQYGQETYKIRLELEEKYKDGLENFKKLSIYSEKLKMFVPITELVNVQFEPGLSQIRREALSRAVTVKANVDKTLISSVEAFERVEESLRDFTLPKGYRLLYRGENEDRDESFRGLQIAFIFGVFVIYCVVVFQLQSLIQPLSVILSLPLSVLGISLTLILFDRNLSIMTMFGLVTLTGIVVNDSIVLVTYLNIYREKFKGMGLKQVIIEASETRVRPIFLTTITTIGGMLPLSLNLGGSGRDFFSVFGLTVIGGLTVATFQILIIVPVLYHVFEDLKQKFFRLYQFLSLKFKRKDLEV